MTGFFRRILSREKSPAVDEPDTIPLPKLPDLGEKIAAAKTASEMHLAVPQLISGCAQSVGRQRDHNEDALFTLTTTLASDTRQIPFGLYIVADGMGGHQHGEVASAMAIRAMAGIIIRKIYLPLFNVSAAPPEESFQEIMQEGILEAHRTILKQALGGGTTLTALLIVGEQMIFAHVGDSRAYFIPAEGPAEILTRDHSLVKRLVELGQITAEEALSHPQRNVLYRAIGQGEPFEPDIAAMPIPINNDILLCSDGLWGVIDQEMLLSIIRTAEAPHEACQKLIEAANEAGGPDNISAILVRMMR